MSAEFLKIALRQSSAIQADARRLGLVEHGATRIGDVLSIVSDPGLRATVESLFAGGHYSRAVEEGIKYLQQLVRTRSKLTTDGSDLMRTAFSANNPLLFLNDFKSQSEKDEQRGYMDIMAGCVVAIRNPRAHTVGSFDEESAALEMLSLTNHLVGVARKARVKRRRK